MPHVAKVMSVMLDSACSCPWYPEKKNLENEADRYRYRDADVLREDLPAADVTLEGGVDDEDLVFVFPDSGCC